MFEQICNNAAGGEVSLTSADVRILRGVRSTLLALFLVLVLTLGYWLHLTNNTALTQLKPFLCESVHARLPHIRSDSL